MKRYVWLGRSNPENFLYFHHKRKRGGGRREKGQKRKEREIRKFSQANVDILPTLRTLYSVQYNVQGAPVTCVLSCNSS